MLKMVQVASQGLFQSLQAPTSTSSGLGLGTGGSLTRPRRPVSPFDRWNFFPWCTDTPSLPLCHLPFDILT